jgi:hypothetical protein
MDDSQITASTPQDSAALAVEAPNDCVMGETPKAPEKQANDKQKPQQKPQPGSIILKTVVIFYTIVSVVWISFAWGEKRPLYSAGPILRRIGETYRVEVTLIREDRQHLACADLRTFSRLHCGYKKPGVAWLDNTTDDALLLRPYSTVEGEQLLAAGLWSQPALYGTLPSQRFSVLCNFHTVGAVRDVSVRWNVTAAFAQSNKVLFVGSLTNCVLPQ